MIVVLVSGSRVSRFQDLRNGHLPNCQLWQIVAGPYLVYKN